MSQRSLRSGLKRLFTTAGAEIGAVQTHERTLRYCHALFYFGQSFMSGSGR